MLVPPILDISEAKFEKLRPHSIIGHRRESSAAEDQVGRVVVIPVRHHHRRPLFTAYFLIVASNLPRQHISINHQ